jgi:predicted MFS family arabinose efflux permease
VTFSGSLFLLVFALVRGNTLGWGSAEIVAMLSAAAILLVGFVIAERVQERPMLDLSLFKRPAFVGASVVAFTLSSSAFAMFLYLTLYIQDVLHYSPLQAGLRFLPTTLVMFFVSPLAGRLSVRVPIRLLLGVGLLFVGGGLLAMTAVTPTSGWTALVPGFVLQGIGVGLINPPLASAAVGVVPPARSGMASGANSTFRQVGIATGIAALGAVFQHDLGAGASAQHASRAAFVGAFTNILGIAALVAFAGAVAAFALVRSKDFVASQATAPAPMPAESSAREPLVAGAREHG